MFCYATPVLITDIYDPNPQALLNGSGDPPLTRPKSADGKALHARHNSIKRAHSFSLIVNNTDFDCSFSPPNVTVLRDCFDSDYEMRKGSATVSSPYPRSNSSSSMSSPRVADVVAIEQQKEQFTTTATATTNQQQIDDVKNPVIEPAATQQLENSQQQQQNQSTTVANNDNNNNNNNTKTTTTTTDKPIKQLVFKKQKVVTVQKRTSELSTNANLQKKPRTAIMGIKHKFAIVFIQDTQKKVTVTITESTRAMDIIRNVANIENYVLHVAHESRGQFTIDDMYPALSHSTYIMNLGIQTFILVSCAKRRESNSIMQSNRSSLLLKERGRGTLEDIILEVYKSYSTTAINIATEIPNLMPVAPDLLIKDLQKIFASKFEIDEKKFQLYWIKEDGTSKTIPKHYRDRTLRSVPGLRRISFVRIAEEESVVINRRLSTNGAVVSEEEDNDLVLPFDIDAQSYQEFRVIKTNKFGVRQERKLGIDAHTIHNLKPNSITSFLGLQSPKTKHPERPLETLTAVTPNPDNPKTFTLDFVDGETLYYETRTTVECHEICKRLKYLLKLKKQEQNDSLLRRRSISIMALNKSRSNQN